MHVQNFGLGDSDDAKSFIPFFADQARWRREARAQLFAAEPTMIQRRADDEAARKRASEDRARRVAASKSAELARSLTATLAAIRRLQSALAAQTAALRAAKTAAQKTRASRQIAATNRQIAVLTKRAAAIRAEAAKVAASVKSAVNTGGVGLLALAAGALLLA